MPKTNGRFLSILLLLVSMTCSSSDKNCNSRLAVITASFGSYDSLKDIVRRDVSNCVDYFYFTDIDDNNRHYALENCTVIKHPYHLEDSQSQEVRNADGSPAKNTRNGVTTRFRTQRAIKARLNNLSAKYYKVLAWKIPILAEYRYILYHDANFLIGNDRLFQEFLSILQNYSYVAISHPRRWGGIQWEAVEATYQLRYRLDGVKNQTKNYLRQGYPDNPKNLLYGGTFFYDAWDPTVRSMFQEWWREILLWSIEDQISYPYVFWKLGIENYRALVDAKRLCSLLYPDAPIIPIGKFNSFGYCYSEHIVSKKEYGKIG